MLFHLFLNIADMFDMIFIIVQPLMSFLTNVRNLARKVTEKEMDTELYRIGM